MIITIIRYLFPLKQNHMQHLFQIRIFADVLDHAVKQRRPGLQYALNCLLNPLYRPDISAIRRLFLKRQLFVHNLTEGGHQIRIPGSILIQCVRDCPHIHTGLMIRLVLVQHSPDLI